MGGFGGKVRIYDFCVLSIWFSNLVIKIIIWTKIFLISLVISIYLLNIDNLKKKRDLEESWRQMIFDFM